MARTSPGPPVNSNIDQATGLPLAQQVLLEQKQAFVEHCRKLMQVSNKKYEALASFLQDH